LTTPDLLRHQIGCTIMFTSSDSCDCMQVDAFTDVPFGGNSAAVVLLPPNTELNDATRQQIAMEMNLSETAFLEPLTDAGEPYAASEVPAFRSASRYRLRWFTPTQEVQLCGHATVASAAALIQGVTRITIQPVLAAWYTTLQWAAVHVCRCSGQGTHSDVVRRPVGWQVCSPWPCSAPCSCTQAHLCECAGEGHPADEPLLFDTVHSGQLSVQRLSREAQPLLQLGMPWRAPDDPPPNGITADSPVIQVCGDPFFSEQPCPGACQINRLLDTLLEILIADNQHSAGAGQWRCRCRAGLQQRAAVSAGEACSRQSQGTGGHTARLRQAQGCGTSA
jgi:Phenazine biosynthesis-like protein